MADYDGLDLGPVAETRYRPGPASFTRVVIPGVRGYGLNWQGSRGGRTEAYGVLYGESHATLAALQNNFYGRAYDGTTGVLTDTLGRTWNNVLLTDFEPVGEVSLAPGFGWAQAYRAEFTHLSES